MLLGLVVLVRAVVELAEAEVAVDDEGAPAEFVGQSEGLLVVASRQIVFWEEATSARTERMR